MPTFNITARKTTPLTPLTVESDTREGAIQQVLDTGADEGGTVEVLTCTELTGAAAPPARRVTGATGATGTARR